MRGKYSAALRLLVPTLSSALKKSSTALNLSFQFAGASTSNMARRFSQYEAAAETRGISILFSAL